MTQRLKGLPRAAELRRSEARERELLAGVVLRDRHAFEELYLLYYHSLGRFLRRHLSQPGLAEEVINDTFWIVWRKAAAFRGQSSVSTWIMGIAYRRALKALRRLRSSSRAETGDYTEAMELHDPSPKNHEMEDWVAKGLALLPVQQRVAVELAYYLGHSFEEIGAIMGCRASTVKARMFHARTRLRSALERLSGQGAP
jgi:RNA polymerase sigma-70 factor (ECF subfamily)